MAQMTRAFLAASATATTLNGRRASIARSQGSRGPASDLVTQVGGGTQDQQSAQLAIALLGHRPRALFAAGAELARREPDPSRKVARALEHAGIRHRGLDGGRPQRSHPGDLHQPAQMRSSLLAPCHDARLERVDVGLSKARHCLDQEASERSIAQPGNGTVPGIDLGRQRLEASSPPGRRVL